MAATGLLGINPYGKGVLFDISSKPISLAIQHQQKEQARNEALDQYFMNLDKDINSAGMRNNDVNDLMQMKLDAKKYYFQNKDNIIHPEKDNGKSYTEYMNLNTNMFNHVNQSKKEAAGYLAGQKALEQAKRNGEIVTPETFLALQNSANYSLKDPRFKSFDIGSFDAYKPHNERQFYNNVWGNITMPTKEETIYQKDKLGKPTGMEAKQTTEVLTPEVLNNAALGAINEYRSNRGTKAHFEELYKSPEFIAKVNPVFKTQFNRDIQNPEELAIGYALTQRQPGVIKTTDFQPGYEKKMQDRLLQSMKLKDYGKDEEGGDFSNALTGLVESSKINTKNVYNEATGKNEKWSILPVTKDIKSSFTVPVVLNRRDAQGNIIPGTYTTQKEVDQILVNPKGEFIGFTQKLDDQGKPIAGKFQQQKLDPRMVAEKYLAPYTTSKNRLTAVNQALANYKPSAEPEDETIYTISGKNYTMKQLMKDFKYTQDQINQAIKLGNIKKK